MRDEAETTMVLYFVEPPEHVVLQGLGGDILSVLSTHKVRVMRRGSTRLTLLMIAWCNSEWRRSRNPRSGLNGHRVNWLPTLWMRCVYVLKISGGRVNPPGGKSHKRLWLL